MTAVEHNNSISGLPGRETRASKILTLTGLIEFIDASESIPASQKRYLRSALNRARVLLGNGLADVRADPKDVLRRLDQLSPAIAGMTPQSWANLKSRVRSALRHAAPQLAPAHSRIRLEREWAALAAASPRRERCQLSRLFRFAQGRGWLPGDIGEPQLEQFEDHLEHEAIHSDSVHVVRTTRRAWNRCVDKVPGWPDRRLAAPAPRGTRYWLRLEQLPETLQQEIGDYLHRLEHPDPFLGPGGKTLAPTTINQFRLTFITLASALVASGMPVDELSSIPTLVQPQNLERALRFLYARAGHRVYHMMFRVALRARTIGGHVGLPEQELARIDSIAASVRREHAPEYGLTPKNRRLLAHFDDPAFVDRLLTFPQRLVEAAKTATNKRHAATRARDAVAVELLLMCGIRLGNLASLRVGETIRKVGEGRDARWVVDLPAEQVKNKQPLRFLLPPESGRMLEWYLTDWHAYWCGPGVPWLFPARGGGHVDPPLLTISIKRRARRYVGVEITCHQFRHLSSEVFLQAHPLELGVVSQHLGHRKLDTTRTYYAREQIRVATERYHQVLARKRAEALARPRRKRGHRGIGPMTPPRLCLPLEDWPAIDRARWLAAQEPGRVPRGHQAREQVERRQQGHHGAGLRPMARLPRAQPGPRPVQHPG